MYPSFPWCCVREVLDIAADDTDLALVKLIAGSEKTIIRFQDTLYGYEYLSQDT